MITIYADFNNLDTNGRVRLNLKGTQDSLAGQAVQLADGMKVLLDDNEELRANGIVTFSEEEHIWVAAFEEIKCR